METFEFEDTRYQSPAQLEQQSKRLFLAVKILTVIIGVLALTCIVLGFLKEWSVMTPLAALSVLGATVLVFLTTVITTKTNQASHIRNLRMLNPEPFVRIVTDGEGVNYHSNNPVELHKDETGRKIAFNTDEKRTIVEFDEMWAIVPEGLYAEIPFPD